MDSWDDFTFSNLHYSQSQSSSIGNEVTEIKKMLLSGDEQERTCAVSNILYQMADNDGAIEMINSDICQFLCDAMLPFDSSISETIYNCLEIMVKFEEFFTHKHSSIAIESVVRSMNLIIKNGAYDSIVRYPLQTLKLIVQRYVEFNIPPEKTIENVANLLLDLLKNSPTEEVKYQSGEIIRSLLDIELSNLKTINSLGDVCEKWFDVICMKNENYQSLPKRIAYLGFTVSEQTLRYLSKKTVATSQFNKNKDFESLYDSNIMKNILTFLIDFSFPHIQIGSYPFEEQDIQRLEHYFMSFSYILKAFPGRKQITQKLSEMGYVQLLSNILSFSHRFQCKQLGKICVEALTEILLSLSYDVFLFPDIWPNGRDNFTNEIVKGLSLISLDSTRWAENLVETNVNPSAKLALTIYFYFHSLTSKSPVFNEVAYSSMVKFVNTSLEKDSSPLQVKVVWFIYATLRMSQNSLRLGFNNWINKKLLDILGSQMNFSLIYTHHPTMLNWAFSSSIIARKIQCEIVKLWLEQSSPYCAVLDDLLKKSEDVRLVLFEIIQKEHEHSTHSAFIYLKNFILESKDEPLSHNIWCTLPQFLEKYATDAISVIKVDYTIELATLRVLENPDMDKIVRIASLLPAALEKTDLISVAPSLKLCLQLLQMSVRYEEPRVLYEFLRCERFTQKIVSAMDINISELALTSLNFITVLWSNSFNSAFVLNNCNKIILDAYTILKIINSPDLELVKMGLVLLEQMLATGFQSNLLIVQGVSSDYMKIVFFHLENTLIRYFPLISGPVWICLKHCLSLNNQESLVEDAFLHEVIEYCLPYLKDTPEMMDFLIIWIEQRKEREKYCSGYSPIKESYFTITVRGIAAFLAKNNFENSEPLCHKILEFCDNFFIDKSQEPFNKIRARTSVHE